MPAATIAPMIAMPSEPPTWRMLFSTAEPTPALSRPHRAHRRRGRRRHRRATSRRRRAASPGRSVPEVRVRRPCARRASSEPASTTIPPATSGRGPIRSDSRPACGARRMIRTVQGRNAAPACDRRVAEHLLDVERDVEEDAEHREPDEQHHACSRPRSRGCGRARARASAAAGAARAGRTRRARRRRRRTRRGSAPTSSRTCSPRSARS